MQSVQTIEIDLSSMTPASIGVPLALGMAFVQGSVHRDTSMWAFVQP